MREGQVLRSSQRPQSSRTVYVPLLQEERTRKEVGGHTVEKKSTTSNKKGSGGDHEAEAKGRKFNCEERSPKQDLSDEEEKLIIKGACKEKEELQVF